MRIPGKPKTWNLVQNCDGKADSNDPSGSQAQHVAMDRLMEGTHQDLINIQNRMGRCQR